MRANNTIYFAVRASKSRNNGTSPIQVQLTKDKQRVSFSTGRSVKVSDWDQTHQRVRGRGEESMELNRFLEATKARLNYLEGVLIDRGLGASPQMLRDAYLDKLDCLKDWTLMTLIENHLDELRGKIGKSIAKRTVKNYEYGARFIRNYMRSQYGREDMSIKEVRIGFISGFHSWLLSKRQMQQNSTTKYLKFLQKIMNLAVMNGYISYNSLSMYKVVREPVTPDYLDEEELQTKYGVNPSRLSAAGRGEYNTVADNDTPEGRAKNRRTQIIITPKLDQFLELIDKAPATDEETAPAAEAEAATEATQE